MKFDNVVVLIADGKPDSQGDICLIDNVEIPAEDITVRVNFDPLRPVGKASLRKDGNRVLANIEIFPPYDRPVATLAVPSVGGAYSFRDAGGNCGLKVREVGLCDGPNTDDRILAIGKQETVISGA